MASSCGTAIEPIGSASTRIRVDAERRHVQRRRCERGDFGGATRRSLAAAGGRDACFSFGDARTQCPAVLSRRRRLAAKAEAGLSSVRWWRGRRGLRFRCLTAWSWRGAASRDRPANRAALRALREPRRRASPAARRSATRNARLGPAGDRGSRVTRARKSLDGSTLGHLSRDLVDQAVQPFIGHRSPAAAISPARRAALRTRAT